MNILGCLVAFFFLYGYVIELSYSNPTSTPIQDVTLDDWASPRVEAQDDLRRALAAMPFPIVDENVIHTFSVLKAEPEKIRLMEVRVSGLRKILLKPGSVTSEEQLQFDKDRFEIEATLNHVRSVFSGAELRWRRKMEKLARAESFCFERHGEAFSILPLCAFITGVTEVGAYYLVKLMFQLSGLGLGPLVSMYPVGVSLATSGCCLFSTGVVYHQFCYKNTSCKDRLRDRFFKKEVWSQLQVELDFLEAWNQKSGIPGYTFMLFQTIELLKTQPLVMNVGHPPEQQWMLLVPCP